MNGRDRGFALILVIWSLVLLASLATGFAFAVRHEARAATDMAAIAHADAAATAALHTAILALSDNEDTKNWQPDSQPHSVAWPDATVSVRVQSESGRIDINRAPRELLVGLFSQLFADRAPEALADALIDWRDSDDDAGPSGAERDAYARAGYTHGPANAAFNSVNELNRVLGFDNLSAATASPYLTVHSRKPRINVWSADLVVLASVPGIDRDGAGSLIAQRERILAEGGRMDFSAFRSGRQYLETRRNDRLLSVDIDVRLDDGFRRREHAVIMLKRNRGYTLIARETRPLQPGADGGQP